MPIPSTGRARLAAAQSFGSLLLAMHLHNANGAWPCNRRQPTLPRPPTLLKMLPVVKLDSWEASST